MSPSVPHMGYTYLNLLDSPELLQILVTLTTVTKPLMPNFLGRDNVILNFVRRLAAGEGRGWGRGECTTFFWPQKGSRVDNNSVCTSRRLPRACGRASAHPEARAPGAAPGDGLPRRPWGSSIKEVGDCRYTTTSDMPYYSAFFVRATDVSATIFGDTHTFLFPVETDGDIGMPRKTQISARSGYRQQRGEQGTPYSARLGDCHFSGRPNFQLDRQ